MPEEIIDDSQGGQDDLSADQLNNEDTGEALFEHEGQSFTQEQLVELLGNHSTLQEQSDRIEKMTGGAGFDEFAKWARQESMTASELRTALEESKAAPAGADALADLDPDAQEALGTVNEHLIAPLAEHFNGQMEEFQHSVLDLLEPIIEQFQLGQIKSGAPDIDEAKVRETAATLSEQYGFEVPLRLAADFLKAQGGYEKGAAAKEAELLRKRGALVPSGGAKGGAKGIKPYDPDKDKDKPYSQLFQEGFNQSS